MASDETDPVRRQYEAYPYPERDPADEARRLIEGSPSHPCEIDHFLFAGKRDWRAPFRALVAGGGTGDAAIMLGALLARRGTPAEIVYLDLSKASRAVAETRAAARGLEALQFVTGDLTRAPDLGPFDYIDCCGVLHHLPDPDAGVAALAAALGPEGGLGAMVYAPYGRSGVYEAQAALRPLVADAPPAERVALAKAALAALPPTNLLARNPMIRDHIDGGDAGVYDLLLHERDVAYDAPALYAALDRAGLRLAGFVEPARYDPRSYVSDPALAARLDALDAPARAAFAERFAGNIKAHVFYAVRSERGDTVARASDAQVRPVLHAVSAGPLSKSVAKTGRIRFNVEGLTLERRARRSWPALIAAIDGRATLAELQARSGMDWTRFQTEFAPLAEALGGFNALRFSGFHARSA